MTEPRRFYLDRHTDVTGVSGTGRVADGVLWPDGTASLRWRGDRPSIVFWDRMADAEHVHGHVGATRIVWLDPETTDPRAVGGDIAGPGGPTERNSVVIDSTRAVLLDAVECALVEIGDQGVALALLLSGRINKTTDHANALFLMDTDGAASIVSELVALGSRVGPEFATDLSTRIARLIEDGATGRPSA